MAQRSSALLLTPQCVTILARSPLSAAQHQLLWLLAQQLGDEVKVVSLTELAERAQLTRVTTVRAVQHLLRCGLVARGARVGASYQYKLNPAYLRAM